MAAPANGPHLCRSRSSRSDLVSIDDTLRSKLHLHNVLSPTLRNCFRRFMSRQPERRFPGSIEVTTDDRCACGLDLREVSLHVVRCGFGLITGGQQDQASVHRHKGHPVDQ
jgi:hypothetical protein